MKIWQWLKATSLVGSLDFEPKLVINIMRAFTTSFISLFFCKNGER